MLQTFNEKNRELLINISGQLVHRNEAGISPFDSAVQGGDAVWEGLRLYNGKIFKLYEHLDRLRSSALALAFAEIPSHDAIVDEINYVYRKGFQNQFEMVKFIFAETPPGGTRAAR